MGCVLGTLTAPQYRARLLAAAFMTITITPAHPLTGALTSAIVRAQRADSAARDSWSRSHGSRSGAAAWLGQRRCQAPDPPDYSTPDGRSSATSAST